MVPISSAEIGLMAVNKDSNENTRLPRLLTKAGFDCFIGKPLSSGQQLVYTYNAFPGLH